MQQVYDAGMDTLSEKANGLTQIYFLFEVLMMMHFSDGSTVTLKTSVG